MPMKVEYTVIDGEIIAENRGGEYRTYVPDGEGSTVALLDSNQQQTDTFTYWPFGEARQRTGTTSTNLRFMGVNQFYTLGSGLVSGDAEYLSPSQARLQTPGTAIAGTSRYATSFASARRGRRPIDPNKACVARPTFPHPPPPGNNPISQTYGWYCGTARAPFHQMKKPPPPFDALDACCCRHDAIYENNNCHSKLQPPQAQVCKDADKELCKCAKKVNCATSPNPKECSTGKERVKEGFCGPQDVCMPGGGPIV